MGPGARPLLWLSLAGTSASASVARADPPARTPAPPSPSASASVARADPPARTPAPPSPSAPPGEREALAERPLGAGSYRPGEGVTLRSQDGRFALCFAAWAQLLGTTRREQSPVSGAAATTVRLELRRARVVLQGHVFTPHVKYHVQLMFAPRELGFKDGAPTRTPIFQWTTAATRLANAQVQAGFFFVPYARQRMTPLSRLQFADNSTASDEFTQDQDMGVQVSAPDLAGLGRLRYYAGVFLGEGPAWYRAGDAGFTYAGRLELLPLGMFADFDEPDLERERRPRLSLGAGYAFADRDHRTRALAGTSFADGGTMSAHNLSADLLLKWAGLSLLADVYWRRATRRGGGRTDEDGAPVAVQAARNGHGWTAQLGIFVPRTRLQAVARDAGVRPPRRAATSLARLDEVGGGLNYYFFRHALKLQLDYVHTWGPALATGRGDQVRAQLQLMF